MIDAVRKSIRIPLTIKIRTGWERSGAQAFETARIAEDSGVDAIAVHPRLASQGFGGKADWPLIKAIKEQCKIPVIGNGDIVTAGDCRQDEKRNQMRCSDDRQGGHRQPVDFFPDDRALPGGICSGQLAIDTRFNMMVRYLRKWWHIWGRKTPATCCAVA